MTTGIIPIPRNLKIVPGEISLTTPITLSGDSRTIPIQLHFERISCSLFKAIQDKPDVQIWLELIDEMVEEVGEEGYQLQITSQRITIRAAKAGGLFYGMQTLIQLLPPDRSMTEMNLPCGTIIDSPRFKYRGFMLDEARHFFGMETIKQVLDWLAFFKVNMFHWHLTDYQGWRVEIKKYPRLTEIGGRRTGSQTRSFTKKFSGMDMRPHACWYTQDEIREIIAYAAERQITIVPELDLPGHFGAALAAYPHLGCTKEAMEVRREWGIFKDVACVGSQETREFLYDVLDEFCNLFPGPYIHLGGDEVETDHWQACPECQRVKDEKDLESFSELNPLIMNDLGAFVRSKGMTPIVWNEALHHTLDKSTVIMHWTPKPLSLLWVKRALRDGHQAIFQSFRESYFDYAHSLNSLSRVYRAKTLEKISPSEWNGVLGVQGALWTEFVANEDRIQWNSFPRMAAKAEVGWSIPENRNYKDFKIRWNQLRGHLYAIGLHNPAPLEACDPGFYRQTMALANDVIGDMHAEQKRWQDRKVISSKQ